MTGAILGVAIATLVTGVVAIIISVKRGGADRIVAVEARDVAKATGRFMEATRAEVESVRQSVDAGHELSIQQRRVQALNEFEQATRYLESLLALYPNRIDTDGYRFCTAQFRSCLIRINEPMELSEKLAVNDTPWDNTVTIGNVIANARREVHAALARN